jgi:hypothetical protein
VEIWKIGQFLGRNDRINKMSNIIPGSYQQQNPDLKPTLSPTWYPGTLVGNIANSTAIAPNIPLWAIPVFGVLAVVLIAGTRFYNVVVFGLIGIILWWLMNK